MIAAMDPLDQLQLFYASQPAKPPRAEPEFAQQGDVELDELELPETEPRPKPPAKKDPADGLLEPAKLKSLREAFSAREHAYCSVCLVAPGEMPWARISAPHVDMHLCDRCLEFLVQRFGRRV